MANLYTIEDLLIGKTYNSKTLSGKIISAEKSKQPVWYGENTEAYLVRVRGEFANYQYRTIAVANNQKGKSLMKLDEFKKLVESQREATRLTNLEKIAKIAITTKEMENK